MTASRVRLVLLAWFVALLVVTAASWEGITRRGIAGEPRAVLP
jgi:hypothetical protein